MPDGFMWEVPKTQHELFLKQDTVPPQTRALLMGVLDEMPFKKSSEIYISVVVVYKKKDSHIDIQLPMDCNVSFRVDAIVEGSQETFVKLLLSGDKWKDPNHNARDFFSAIVSSTCYQLKVGAGFPILAHETLHDVGLKNLLGPWSDNDSSLWGGYHPGGLKGIVLVSIPLSLTEFRIDVYAKDEKQVLLLAHKLSRLQVQEWKPNCTTGLADCSRSLHDELQLLLSAAQHPNVEFSPKAWADFKRNLSALELKTDLDFRSYKPAS